MTTTRSTRPQRAWFMAAIFTLLTINTAAFLVSGTPSEALDSIAWLWRGEWFYAYDAALWLVAFATLEMDVLGFIGKGHPAA